jgi:lactate dehydrogenase-like 2-hydroxyacid dehydrogenase
MHQAVKPTLLLVGRLQSSVMRPLAADYHVLHLWEAADPALLLASHANDIEVVVTSATHGADAALIAALPRLRLIASFGVGFDTIDVAAAQARGIAVTTTPNVLNDCVADTALGLLLAVSRRICEADRFVRAGRWESERFIYGTKLGGKTCGILGLGAIGMAVAKRAQAFDMHVAYCNRQARADVDFTYFDTPQALAEASDFLILTLPGGTETQHIVDRQVLAALGPQGILINIARGSVVDEAALVDMLSKGELGAAGLDVFEDEPHVPKALWQMDNVVLTPHIASATHETRDAMGKLVLANVAAFYAGHALPSPLARI